MTGFLLSALALVPALLVAIPVHELGHAVAAYLLGDRSVRYFGYFKADPRRFLDLLGTIAVFVALVGWGKRVPIQPSRISTVRQKVLYSLGGPAANLAVGIVLGIVLRGIIGAQFYIAPEFSVHYIAFIVYAVWFLNVSIFAFQLLPIPGLDGWDIVEALFRNRNARFFFDVSVRRREIWVGLVVIAFLFQFLQGGSLLSLVMSPFYTPASLISVGQCAGYAVQGFVGLHPCLVQ